MLGNLIENINQTKADSLQIIRALPVIVLSDSDCRNFEHFLQRTLKLRSICSSFSFQVETSPDHWAVCSNQYLALAAVAYKLALCLKEYFDFFDSKIRPNEKETKLIIKLQNEFDKSTIKDIPQINQWLIENKSVAFATHCQNNPEDRDSLCYFLAGIDSKKFGNEKGVLRGTIDLFGSYILSIEPVTTAASGFLGALVYALAQKKDFYERISDIFKESSQRQQLNSHLELEQSVAAPPTQIIYYGVPGSGKSHQIQEDLKAKGITEENHQQKRVVFHPDYCNADFVGQILPVTKRDGGIRYQFKAGPFTKILRDAYENPTKEYALIIEEINRGNAAAVFGDLFQLLDRKKENDPIETVNDNSYGPGWSDYCIENDYINAYFRGAYDSEDVPNPLPPKTLGSITFNDNVDIRLPPNLSIYATMNTSDQNVFTLDNAFQRRWEMKQISNDLAHDDPAADTTKQYDQIIGNTNVKWGEFREAINEIIMQSAEENGLSSMEDKRLGGWFITPKKDPNAAEGETPKITNEAFAEKVLKYLWDDAFKFDRPKHFGEIKTLEDLTKKFKTDGFKIFKDESISKLSQQNGTSAAQTGTPEA